MTLKRKYQAFEKIIALKSQLSNNGALQYELEDKYMKILTLSHQMQIKDNSKQNTNLEDQWQ